MSWSLKIILEHGLGDAALASGESPYPIGFNIEDACRELDAERDKYRAALERIAGCVTWCDEKNQAISHTYAMGTVDVARQALIQAVGGRDEGA